MSHEPPGHFRKFGNKYENSSNRLPSSFSSGEKPVLNGVAGSFSRPDESRERRDFKLLIDPAIKKGHQKTYRFDGVFPGQLPVVPKDPRSRRTRIWTQIKADLPVPNFKVDKNYVGIPPQREVLFTGLNDNVDKKFLHQMCERYGKIENIKVYYDPATKKHSGKARIIFSTTTAAKLVMSKLDSTSVMGNVIRAHLEPNLKALKHMVKQQRDHAPPRRGSNEDEGMAPRHRLPAVAPKFLTHLPTPPLSMTSHSPLSDSSFSTAAPLVDPRLESPLSLKPPPPPPPPLTSDASPDCASSWSKISFPKPGYLMSPQSLASSSASFEPISPPPAPHRVHEPPPPPPPVRPPSPPEVEPTTNQQADNMNHSSDLNFEDISPDPVFSPEEIPRSTNHEKSNYQAKPETESLTKGRNDEGKINRLIESCRRNASRGSHGEGSRDRHSPRADSWNRDRKHHSDREDRRDRYRDKDRGSDGWDRGERDRYSPRERRFDKHSDFKAGYRHRKNRWNDRRDEWRDDYGRKYERRDNNDRHWSHRRDRQTEDRRKSEGSDMTHKMNDSRTRDREVDNRSAHHSYRHVTETKEGEDTERESDSHWLRKNDLSLECVESTPHDSGRVSDIQNHSGENESDSEPVKVEDVAEIISQVVSGDAPSKLEETGPYDEDAYTVGIEACSDEEPLPPGDEGDVADKVNKDRSRNKLKAAQDYIRKRKHSSETVDDRQGGSVKPKKQIQIVVRSRQLSETGTPPSGSLETPCKDEDNNGDPQDNFRGGWTMVSVDQCHESEINTLLSDSSEQKDSQLELHGDLPVVEDISPCPSPTSVQVTEECTITTTETIVRTPEEDLPSTQLQPELEKNEHTGGVENDDDAPDDDNMSLSSISSNEETFQVNEPVKKTSPRQKQVPVNIPPPRLPFPPFPPPPSFNPGVPPPAPFNPMVPPPLLGRVTVPPPPLHPATAPPPSICPPIVPPPSIPPPSVPPITVPPPPINPSVPPPPILPSAVPHMPIPPPGVPPPGVPPPLSTVPPPTAPPHVPPPTLRTGFYDGASNPHYPNRGSKYDERPPAPRKTLKRMMTDEVFSAISSELTKMVNRDVFRKLIETSAFKALEAWWDNQTKPKQSASQLTKRDPSIHPPHGPSPSTIGQPSNMSAASTMLGPSPFERQHSMVHGLKASLPKLPSFKVKRAVQPPQHDKDPGLSLKRSGADSPVPSETATKRPCPEDSEVDTELDSSRGPDRRHRTTSRMEEEERSESPWQHLEDSMDMAPPATRVRSTIDIVEAGRRTSTGSSLYHTVYSSSEGSDADDGSESADSEAEDSEAEESEAEESAAESEVEEEETEADSEEESDEDSERGQRERAEQSGNSFRSGGSPRPINRTLQTVTVYETTNYQAQRAAAMDELAPAAGFKRPAPLTDEKAVAEELSEEETRSSEQRTTDGPSDADVEDTLTDRESARSSSELDETSRSGSSRAYSPARLVLPSESGRLGSTTEETETASDSDEVFGELVSTPDVSSVKSRALSLVELDHPYGMSASEEEMTTPASFKEEPASPLHPPRDGLDSVGLDTWTRSTRTPSPIIDVENVQTEPPFLKPETPALPPPEPVVLKPTFSPRSYEEDDALVYDMVRWGLDAEDARYLKVGFERLMQVGSESVLDAHWGFHPDSNSISAKRRKQRLECGVRVHATGCARSEGYYKLSMSEKARYLETARRQLQVQESLPDEQQKFDGSKAKQQSREHRLVQRRLQSAVIKEDFGDLLKFNQLRVRKKQLKFAKSAIHDWGLFAQEPIAADEMVIEYVGEMIRQPVADLRERRYEDSGIGSSYMFRVDHETIIDATTLGNLARFINHCCDPNCYARIISVENNKKIVIYSKRDIKLNEEITYDYKFPIEEEKIPCLCGVPQCRGTLN